MPNTSGKARLKGRLSA